MFKNGENLHGKNPPGDFKVTTLENPLLSQQAVISKGIPIPYTNLQLNPYYNTQLDLFCNDNLSFQCMAPGTWLTHRCVNPSTRLNHQLEKDVGCKVLQFITRWRSLKARNVWKHKSLFRPPIQSYGLVDFTLT